MGLDMMLYKTNKIAGMRDKEVLKLDYEELDSTEIAYWRKSNQIHNWFYKNCARQNQEDYDRILVTKEDLEELLEVCNVVKKSIKLIDGKIKNGQRYQNGKWEDVYVDGKYIEDSSVAEKLLPTVEGFFFGTTEYNEYYAEDIDDTISQLEHILNDDIVDWENEIVYYYASY